MIIKVLGSGGMFTTKNFHSNFLFKMDDGNNLLVDCGSDIKWSLLEQGLTYKDVDAIYVSHLHGDHAGGLEYIGFLKYFDPTQIRPKLFISKLLLNDLWSLLKPSMSSYQGKILSIDDYFDVRVVENNSNFIYGSVKFNIVQTFHIMDGFRIVPSFGLTFGYSSNSIFFTSDTQFNNMLLEFYKDKNLILQEVETTPYESGVHCHINKLKMLPKNIKSSMFLYHYGDNVLDQTYDMTDFNSFKGILRKGDCINIDLESYTIIPGK